MPDDTDEPAETLEPIAYLSRSANRVQVLEALTENITNPGRPREGYEPRELKEATGASEATVSRIISEFEERRWVRRNTDGEYEATPKGELVATEFGPFVKSMETIEELDEIAAILPIPELTIGVHHFSDATIRRPMGFDPNEFGLYLNDLIEDSTVFYVVTYVAAPQNMADPMGEAIRSGQLISETVMPGSVIDYTSERLMIEDPAQVSEPEQMWTDEPGNTWYRYEGHLPCNLFIFDETVVIENSQAEDIEPGTVIQSQNETVREWAMDLYHKYREASERVERATFVDE